MWLALLGLMSAHTVVAAEPPGPRLAFIRSGEPLPGDELLTTDPSGGHWLRLAHTPGASGFLGGATWSGDGTMLAFSRGFFDSAAVYTVPASGGKPRAVPGTKHGGGPVFSPDGRAIAFSRLRFRREGGRGPYLSTSIWLADLKHDRSHQLMPWRHDLHLIPSSFSPDGAALIAARIDEREENSEIVTVAIDGGRSSLIIGEGTEPAYSPDGSKIAFVRQTRRPGLGRGSAPGGDLYIAAADGSAIRRLTFNPARREASPSWDPSGQRLAYAQFPAKQSRATQEGIGSAVVEINADGTCRHRLLFTYGISYREPAWQPGPGREAGRIKC